MMVLLTTGTLQSPCSSADNLLRIEVTPPPWRLIGHGRPAAVSSVPGPASARLIDSFNQSVEPRESPAAQQPINQPWQWFSLASFVDPLLFGIRGSNALIEVMERGTLTPA